MEKERVVAPRILDQPMHRSEEILLRRLAHGVLLVVGQDDHVFSLIPEVFDEVARHIPHIVDAAP